MFDFIKKLLGIKTTDFAALIEQGAVIIDVRTAAEFKSGNVKGSFNIHVQDIINQLEKIKKMGKPIITCCASGMRSGAAVGILKNAGVESYNGGTWQKMSVFFN